MNELELQLLIQGVAAVVFGAICAAMAPGRGRSAAGWFFLGFFFNCVALVILLVIPNLKLEQEKSRRRLEETRKLREQIKKERQVADERHVGHGQRLTVHDRALGVDTAPGERALPPPLPAPQQPATWFYAVGTERRGPVTADELRQLWLDQQIPDSTLVWCDGMAQWQPIGAVADLLGGDRG